MYKQRFLVTTEVVEKDGCGNTINPVTAGEIRRAVTKCVDYANCINVNEVTLKPVYLLTQTRSYYDGGAKTERTSAIFASRELAENAMRDWCKEVFLDWYGALSLSAEQERDYALAIDNHNVTFADDLYSWEIEEQKING